MGIQDIIKNGQEDTPTSHNPFFNDNTSDDEDIPIAENIYSDSSSDTELSDDESDFLDQSMSSTDSDEEDIQELEERYLYNSLLEDTHRLIEESRQVTVEPSAFTNQPTSTLPKKFEKDLPKSVSKSRQNVGKKKARRIENARQLDQMRGDDDVGDCDINDFMPFECSFRFSKILEDIDLANKVLNQCIDNHDVDYDFTDTSINERNKKSKDNSSKRKKLSAQAAFNNLYASERELFRKHNLPMGMVEYLDACVLSFFEQNPTGTYISEPLSSFERLMLHSIAHFYELKSYSFNAQNFKCRLTKVTNSLDYFDPPCLCLSKFVEQLAAKDDSSHSKRFKRLRRRWN